MSGQRIIIGLLIFLALAGHGYGILVRDSKLPGFEYGFYNFELPEIINGRYVRWTGKDSCQTVHLRTEIMSIIAYCPVENVDSSGLRLSVYLDGRIMDHIHFAKSGIKLRYYYLPFIKSKDVEIKTTVNNTYNPYKMGLSNDPKLNRGQGVALGEVKFIQIMPKDGIGFYEMEKADEGEIPGWPTGIPATFRWTGMQATIPSNPDDYANKIKRKPDRSGMVLFLKCEHPKIGTDPVIVKISADINLIKQIIFSDHQWQKVSIEPGVLEQSRAITFRVNRTWNSGISNMHQDGQDKGVAVAILRE